MSRILSAAFALLVAAPAALAGDVTVFAAASLKTALDDFSPKWEAASGNTAAISYAGSSQLAQQIVAGAPAGVFISASTDWMDAVEKEGLVAERRDLLGNSLVLIAHDPEAVPVELSAGTDLAGLLDGEHLAMALVDSVPAGQYGKAALTSLGLWDGIAPQVAQADNVRAALALVATGEAARDVCLIPVSAHGTNPASAIMAGLKVVVVKCDENGNVDVAAMQRRFEFRRKEALAAD